MQPQEQADQVLANLKALPPERVAEVADFVDFLKAREADRALTHAAARASEPALARLWGNSEDAAYDEL
jgi:hypothetical protein